MSEKRPRGRPPKPPGEARTEIYRARVTAEEKERLAQFLETIRSLKNPSK